MKNILLSCIVLLMSFGLFAQNSLTYKNNALLPGDSSTYREVKFVEPGNAGPNQIWDFSKIQYTGTSPVNFIQPASSLKISGIETYNVLLKDSGYDYFMNSTENRLEERGYINKDKKMTLSYSDPVMKMRYPFFYGDQFIDPFTGVAFFSETSRIDFSGTNKVTADAYGTLIMPDMVLRNVLRVKSEKKGLQISMCGSTEISIVKYSWYAPGFRYPVMNLSTVETRYRGGEPEVTKTANINTWQQHDGSAVAASNYPDKQIEKSDISVIVFPNPFSDKLTTDDRYGSCRDD